ncbi:MAG: hypothetical protein ACP5N5_06325 [Desulfurococcus sp.]|uniref:hypothetical protein n=1 Tax=Desulfurococcus sp. TaxID=51678 RepID=UPI003D10AEA7
MSNIVSSILLLLAIVPALVYLVNTGLTSASIAMETRIAANHGLLYLVRSNEGYRVLIYIGKPPGKLYLYDSTGVRIDLLAKCGFTESRTCIYPEPLVLKPPVYMYIDGVIIAGVVISP